MDLKKFMRLCGEDQFYVATVDDVRYVSNLYWLVPYEGSLAAQCFDWWRVGPEDGVYRMLDGRLSPRQDGSEARDTQRVEAMRTYVSSPRPERTWAPEKVAGHPIVVRQQVTGTYLAVLRPDDKAPETAFVRRSFLTVVDADWADVTWYSDGPFKPIWHPERRAAVMGARVVGAGSL